MMKDTIESLLCPKCEYDHVLSIFNKNPRIKSYWCINCDHEWDVKIKPKGFKPWVAPNK